MTVGWGMVVVNPIMMLLGEFLMLVSPPFCSPWPLCFTLQFLKATGFIFTRNIQFFPEILYSKFAVGVALNAGKSYTSWNAGS